MTEHAVVITGGGPTGLMLAGEFGVGRRGRRDCRAARQPGPSWLARNHIERVLAGWVGELSVPIYRGREVTGFAQDDTGVDVELSDGLSLRAQYLAGCDGGRSLVGKAAGIEFPGVGSDNQQPDHRGRAGR